MVNKRYYSIEGLTGGGKTTLISNLENFFPDFYFYPQEKDKKEFNKFIKNEKILLNPLKDPYEQNRKFEKFLANEQRKYRKFNEILKNRNLLSDRDYLSCFSSAYTHAILENTGNEQFIKDKIEDFFKQDNIEVKNPNATDTIQVIWENPGSDETQILKEFDS